MDISELTTVEAKEAVAAMDNVEDLRVAAGTLKVSFSGNSGPDSLREKIIKALDKKIEVEEKVAADALAAQFGGDEKEDEIVVSKKPKKRTPTTPNDLLMMDPNYIEDPILRRQVVRAKAMLLKRVRITSLDPNDSQLDGAIFTVSNKYTGKVSKYVPFAAEGDNGWHVPQILLDHIIGAKFPMRREIKGGQFGVKRYKTSMVAKYSVENMKALSQEELDELAAHQRASHAIDA